nr:hypothetical protein [Tanacetum cinerariifolium]
MAPLPHHDLRHPRIRYQVEGYDEESDPRQGGSRDYWIGISSDKDFLGPAPSYVHIKYPVRRLCHGMIACSISGRGQGAEKAPQPPPPALQHRNMSQRIDRLEEEVCELRQSVVGLRGLVESFITEQSRVSTWMISCMTHLMDASGHTYQAFDNTLIGSSRVPYQMRVRPRTGDASTSVAPHIEDQSDP